MFFVSRFPTAIAAAACASVLILGMGCTSCTGKPETNEKKPPDLVLNILDVSNPSNSISKIAPMKEVKGGEPDNGVNPDPNGNTNYNYLFSIVATDPGGVASFGYSEVFNTGGPCSPDSSYAEGSNVNVPPQTSMTNPDGTVPTQLIDFINVTAKQENKIVCGGTATSDIPGVYVVTATATNYSNKTKKATWYVNIGAAQSVPQPLKGN
jgi:hypothetical protein